MKENSNRVTVGLSDCTAKKPSAQKKHRQFVKRARGRSAGKIIVPGQNRDTLAVRLNNQSGISKKVERELVFKKVSAIAMQAIGRNYNRQISSTETDLYSTLRKDYWIRERYTWEDGVIDWDLVLETAIKNALRDFDPKLWEALRAQGRKGGLKGKDKQRIAWLEMDKTGMSVQEQADAVRVHRNTITRWRKILEAMTEVLDEVPEEEIPPFYLAFFGFLNVRETIASAKKLYTNATPRVRMLT